MGRPLFKDVNGVRVTRSFVGSEAGIVVEGYFGGVLRTDYQIVKQRGARTFVVVSADAETIPEGDNSINSTYMRVGTLVSGTPSTNGEIRIIGYTNQGQAANNGAVAIAKLTRRIATDFSGNRYKWFLQNDSSADYIVLVAV